MRQFCIEDRKGSVRYISMRYISMRYRNGEENAPGTSKIALNWVNYCRGCKRDWGYQRIANANCGLSKGGDGEASRCVEDNNNNKTLFNTV